MALGRPRLTALDRRRNWNESSPSGRSSPAVDRVVVSAPLSGRLWLILLVRVAFRLRRGELPGLFFLSGLEASELDNFEGSILLGSISGSCEMGCTLVCFFLISSSRFPITALLLIVDRAFPVLDTTFNFSSFGGSGVSNAFSFSGRGGLLGESSLAGRGGKGIFGEGRVSSFIGRGGFGESSSLGGSGGLDTEGLSFDDRGGTVRLEGLSFKGSGGRALARGTGGVVGEVVTEGSVRGIVGGLVFPADSAGMGGSTLAERGGGVSLSGSSFFFRLAERVGIFGLVSVSTGD